MDMAVDRANAKMVWTRTKSLAVVESGNHLAVGIHDFQELLGIEADLRSWDVRQLGPVLEKGAQVIQGTKDIAPYAATVLGLVSLAAFGKRVQDQGKA